MKRYSLGRLLFSFILLITMSLQALAVSSFSVAMLDGSSAIFIVDNDFSMTFSDGMLNLKSESEIISFDMNEIDYCQLIKQKFDISTGIDETMKQNCPVIHYSGSDFTVENCEPYKKIMVLADNGLIVGEYNVDGNGNADFRISHSGVVSIVIPTAVGVKTFRIIVTK